MYGTLLLIHNLFFLKLLGNIFPSSVLLYACILFLCFSIGDMHLFILWKVVNSGLYYWRPIILISHVDFFYIKFSLLSSDSEKYLLVYKESIFNIGMSDIKAILRSLFFILNFIYCIWVASLHHTICVFCFWEDRAP